MAWGWSEVRHSRARIRFIGGSEPHMLAERATIVNALRRRFPDRHTDDRIWVEMACEHDGWRVVSAWGAADPGSRAEYLAGVLDALDRAGVRLTGPRG